MGRSYITISFLILVALIVFKDLLGFGFTWDDRINIIENPLLADSEVRSLLKIWSSPYESLYIPATYTVWFFLAFFSAGFSGGELSSPSLFHIAGLLAHLVNVVLVYHILRILHTRNSKEGVEFFCAAGALLFAVHPVQVEAVCWVTGMKDLLSGLFSLTALWQYALFTSGASGLVRNETGFLKILALFFRSPHYRWATVSFSLALLSKPNAVILPVVAFLLSSMITKRRFSARFAGVFPWIFLSLPFIFVTKYLQPDSDLDFIPALHHRPLIALDAASFYLFKLFFPLNLGMDYGRAPEFIIKQSWFYLSAMAPVFILWSLGKRGKEYSLSLLIFIAGILPVSGIIPFAFQAFSTVADRYLYLSMLGPSIALSFFLRSRPEKNIIILPLAILLCFSLLSRTQARTWRDDVALFTRAARVNPRSAFVRYNLGVTHSGLLEFEKAEKNFLRALDLQPEFPDAMNNLGEVYIKQGKVKKAEDILMNLLQRVPDFERALNNMGIVSQRQGRDEEALGFFRKAVAVKPDYAKAHNNLGVQLASSGKKQEALYHFRQAIKYDPGYKNALNNLDLLLSL